MVSVSALLLGLLPAAAEADSSPVTPVDRAAGWLMEQADNGALPKFDGTVDWALTSDAVLGLATAGATKQQLAPFVKRLEAAVAAREYGHLGAGEVTVADGGALAKLLVIAQVTGTDARDFGGVDLETAVRDELVDGMLGRRRSPAATVQSNTFGQAYVVLGLLRTRTDPRPAVRALLQQQCPAGDFRLGVSTTVCDSPAASADRDVTAMAIHALRAADRVEGIDVTSELDKAISWLAKDQAADGSWIGSPSTDVANTNTTGLAARALAGMRPMSVSRAAGYVRSLQVDGGADDGAVAYTAEALRDGPAQDRTQWLRATTQALWALVHWDVYSVEGTHEYNGRRWRTDCDTASTGGGSCRSYIRARFVSSTQTAGGTWTYAMEEGWVFNNTVRFTQA